MEMKPLTDRDKREICTWHYPGEYAIYDFPPYDEMVQEGDEFTAPESAGRYLGFWAEGALVGFVELQEEGEEVSLGIGVRPDQCGKGRGGEILRLARELSQERYPGKLLSLEVRTWNRRAIRCYESAGFSIEGEAYPLVTGVGPGLFYRMTAQA